MERLIIDPSDFAVRPHHQLSHECLVLGSGSVKNGTANVMTVGWGGFGTMWGRPVVQVVVRPSRHTFQLMEAYPEFTLCALGPEQKDAMQLFGSASGRDTDKIAQSGLELVPCTHIDAPAFAEARLIIECRSIYHSVIDPAGFMDPSIERSYPKKDYHHIWYGEILSIQGSPNYHA